MPNISPKLKQAYESYETNRAASAVKNHQQLENGYEHQLKELKRYQDKLNNSLIIYQNTPELRHLSIARQKQELSVALNKFVQDIKERQQSITLVGNIQPYSTDDLTFSLYLCNRMLRNPTETRTNDFLNFAPAPSSKTKEIAYSLAKAVIGLTFLITGIYFWYRVSQSDFLSKKSSNNESRFNFGIFSPTYNKDHQKHKKQITDTMHAMRAG